MGQNPSSEKIDQVCDQKNINKFNIEANINYQNKIIVNPYLFFFFCGCKNFFF